MAKSNAVALNPNIDKLLKEIVKSRLDNNSLINNKIGVVADLIIKAHKKECKQWEILNLEAYQK